MPAKVSAMLVPFDLADAAASLREQRLVDGPGIDRDPSSIRLHLTGAGIACAERFDSDTRRYQEERIGHRSGPTVAIGSNYGPLGSPVTMRTRGSKRRER